FRRPGARLPAGRFVFGLRVPDPRHELPGGREVDGRSVGGDAQHAAHVGAVGVARIGGDVVQMTVADVVFVEVATAAGAVAFVEFFVDADEQARFPFVRRVLPGEPVVGGEEDAFAFARGGLELRPGV